MPFIESDGVSIHYVVEGDGPPLVLHHGILSYLNDWYDFGYVEALQDEYKMILIDARGHGLSDKPAEPEAYKLKPMTDDVICILDELGLDKVQYIGNSMGGYIGMGLTKYAPERLDSLTVLSYGPFRDVDRYRMKDDFHGLLNRGNEFMASMFMNSLSDDISPRYRAGMDAWLNYFKGTEMAPYINWTIARDQLDLEDIFPLLEIPCLFIAGTQDSYHHNAMDASGLIPNSKLVLLEGFGHVDVFGRIEETLPHIIWFLRLL